MGEDAVSALLANGEQVRWSGEPARRPRVDWIDVVAMVLLAYVVGFTVLWQVLAARTGAPTSFHLVGLIPTGIWIALILGVLLRRRRIGVRYVVTDRRLLLATPSGVDSITLRELPPPHVFRADSRGTATISFGPPSRLAHLVSMVFRGPGAAHRRVQLMQVPHAADVARTLSEAQRTAV